ncbi:hypothetical protein QBC36DRAFT_198921 [Triangularia setosa]|uniref:Uncharacterized protein n=1 Tax=Triangularia setosa TaxID=2587417 RepID=A0AAN6VXI5_9PEZI|nr:hypothetical protein QBC36DRAFT_198921 [Podospora setosa]
MQRSDILQRECKLAAERVSKHWGTASIDVSMLDFPSGEDKENVEILTGLFKEDFQGLNPKYYIPAKRNKQDLRAALLTLGVPRHKLLDGPAPGSGYPNLIYPPGFRLQCLRGRSRAEAVKKALPSRARRLVVDLFHSVLMLSLDIDLALETTLIEEYSAEKDPDDGELYCKIRRYQGYGGPGDPF